MEPSAARKRKGHTKSRHGCQACKRRHNKCDEVRPICISCQRLGDECSFEPANTSSLGLPEHAFTLDDMRLLSQCFAEEPLFGDQDAHMAKQDQHNTMQLALAHPYLLHTKLALAALEEVHRNPSNVKYHERAVAHHLAALSHVRPHLSVGSKEHSEALFVFSALTSLYVFVEPPLRFLSPNHAGTAEPIRDLFTAFRMGRGIRSIMAQHEDHLSELGKPDGSLWPDDRLLFRGQVNTEYPQFGLLSRLVSNSCSPSQAGLIIKALRELFETIALLENRPMDDSSTRLILTWSMDLDPAMLDLLESGDPLALLVLAHFAVLVHLRRNVWFLQRWPEILLTAVEERLGEGWTPYLEWPRLRIRGHHI